MVSWIVDDIAKSLFDAQTCAGVGEYVETVLVDGLHRHLGHVRSADIGRIHAGAKALVKGSAAWVDKKFQSDILNAVG